MTELTDFANLYNIMNTFDDNDIIKINIKRNIEIMSRQMKYHILATAFRASEDIKDKTIVKKTSPEIELQEILEFIDTVKEKRKTENWNTCVYIILCESDKIYVGYSGTKYLKDHTEKTLLNAAKYRLEQHRNISQSIICSNFTHIFSPISLLGYFPGDTDDENLMTCLISKCVGINNVRGGIYSSCNSLYDGMNKLTIDELKNNIMTNKIKVLDIPSDTTKIYEKVCR